MSFRIEEKLFIKKENLIQFQEFLVKKSVKKIHHPRIIESLYEFKKNGLSYFKYFLYKNSALSNFVPDLLKIIFYKGNTGIVYINPLKLVFFNCIYPNFYLSIIYFFFRKIKNKLSKI